jgi:hypothetical protein
MSASQIRYEYLKEKRLIEFRLRLWQKIQSNPKIKVQPIAFWIEQLTNGKFNDVWSPTWDAVSNDNKTLSRKDIGSKRNGGISTKSVQRDGQASEAFERQFLALPGEVRNQIYDELLTSGLPFKETPLFRSNFRDKTCHGGAVFVGSARLPETPWKALRFIGQKGPISDELFDRWCSQVRFNLVEAFEVYPVKRWSRLRFHFKGGGTSRLSRYINSDDSRVFKSSTSWFLHMRACTLKIHLFTIDSLLKAGAKGRDALHSCMVKVANTMQHAAMLTNLHIDVYLWPGRYSDAKEWDSWSQDHTAEGVVSCITPLMRICGVELIHIHGGKVIDGYWDAQHPEKFHENV